MARRRPRYWLWVADAHGTNGMPVFEGTIRQCLSALEWLVASENLTDAMIAEVD